MKLSTEQLKELRVLCNDSTAWASVLDKLIAIRELKGEQVPVALVDERCGSGGFCLTQHGKRLNLQHGTELFTAPQKQVVLRPSLHPSHSYASVAVSGRDEQWYAAIEAAGGIVKDGE